MEKGQIVLDVEWGERTTNQNPRFSKDKHRKLLGEWFRAGRWAPCVSLHLCIWWVRRRPGQPPPNPPRNISKIATANQTECKSALWKELKEKSFEGRRKTHIHFSPFTVPWAQKWVTALQLHSDGWNRTPAFIFSSNELQVFPPAEAQLYYSSWKLDHG